MIEDFVRGYSGFTGFFRSAGECLSAKMREGREGLLGFDRIFLIGHFSFLIEAVYV